MAAASALLLLLLAGIRPVDSDRWLHVATAGEAEVYIDRSGVGKAGDMRVVWQKTVYPRMGSQGEAIVRAEYDCAQRTFIVTDYIFRERSGSLLDRRSVPPANRRTSSAESDPRAAAVIEMVCALG
ncbi:MAG: surface-adhesin E family protein [Allosphingosinicella sp.]|uniref:surface-adhesin E family protein n=1 Tax=Allosphingosinicella sp. TaxID=2823234 RepID=UPI0039447B13